jgi:hypothetical protein
LRMVAASSAYRTTRRKLGGSLADTYSAKREVQQPDQLAQPGRQWRRQL